MYGLLCRRGRIRAAVGRSCPEHRLASICPLTLRERSSLPDPGYRTTGVFAGVRGLAMKVLVIGHQGMLARELLPCLAAAGFTAVSRGRPELNLTQAASVRRTLADVKPALTVNAAAYTAVDQAEVEPEAAFAVNRDGVAHLAT